MPVERASGGTSLIDVLDRVLDKGIVIDEAVRGENAALRARLSGGDSSAIAPARRRRARISGAR
jgi:hypothetical protein